MPADVSVFPGVLRKLGRQTIKAGELDAFFGGSFWRIASKRMSAHSAYLASHCEIEFTLGVDSLVFDSHHNCSRCTWCVAFALNDESEETLRKSGMMDPKGPFAMVPGGGPETGEVCDADALSGGPLFTLRVATTRDCMPTREIYRSQLVEALCLAL